MTEGVQQQICIEFCVKLEHCSMKLFRWLRKLQLWATGDWKLHHNNVPAHALGLVQSFFDKTSSHPNDSEALYSPDLASCNFWLFPKLKSPLEGKRFQAIDEIQENMTGQLMALGRTVWGPKVPTLTGIEASLFYTVFLVYWIFFNTCLCFLHCLVGYLLDRPYIFIY